MTIHRDAAYVKNPNFCPFCKSDEIDAHQMVKGYDAESSANYAWCPVTCDTCETEWHDIYELVGYEEVVAGKDSHA